jgi:OOP family OmpA-OmpF porin
MHLHRKPGLLAAGLLLASLPVAGCGPMVFADGDALAVVGNPPAPEAAPPPPEEPKKRVEVRENKIVINEKVQFEFNKAKILPESHSLLDEVAKVMKEHPEIKKVEVEGHASSEGSDSYNLKLSDKRAKAVMDYLVKTGGIAKEMLTAKGFGETRPLDPADTEEAREKNRRVEFTITEQDVKKTKVEIDEKTGKETVVEGGS